METLIAACNKLDKLKNISGKIAKQDYIKDNKDDKAFLSLLKARLNPYVQYKIKKLTLPTVSPSSTLTYQEFTVLLYELSTSNINNILRDKVIATLGKAHPSIIDVLYGIVTKSISFGIETGVNKALGYELIPTFDVMLAAPIKDYSDLPIPCQVDKKYDGVRCTAIIQDNICSLFTRQGRPLSFPQVEQELLLFANGENLMFDTELELEARTGISGLCNRNLKSGYVKGSDDHIKCYVFDTIPTKIFLAQGVTKKQKERTLDLQKRFAMFPYQKRVLLGESQTVHSLMKLREIANKYISDGFEGIIVKDQDARYYFKRNKAWSKVKAINSTTLEVIGVTDGVTTGKRAGKMGAFRCKSHCGKLHVNVGSGLSDDEIEFYTKNDPTGKFIEVIFNVAIRGDGEEVYSLFLPRFKEIRIDKERADTLDEILEQHIGKAEV